MLYSCSLNGTIPSSWDQELPANLTVLRLGECDDDK